MHRANERERAWRWVLVRYAVPLTIGVVCMVWAGLGNVHAFAWVGGAVVVGTLVCRELEFGSEC